MSAASGGTAASAAARRRSNGNGKASRKVKAAVEEVSPAKVEGKYVEFRGHRFELAPELPTPVLLQLVEIEESDGPLPMLQLLHTMLGQEQFVTVRKALSADDSLDDVTALIDAVFDQYGVGLGESSASPDS